MGATNSASRTIRSIHGRCDSSVKKARKLARSWSRWPSPAVSIAALMAFRRSSLICRTTAVKIAALESKWA